MILKEMISLHKQFLGTAIKPALRNFSLSKALCKSHYDILGVKPDATLAEIKNAYFKLSKIYHPDRIAATDENLEKFRQICNAYEILGNEQSRKLYDRGLLDIKSGGLEMADSDDPIVKFYKQKQDYSKAVKSQAAEMDAWTQTYYKEARKKAIKHNEFFRMKNKARQVEESLLSSSFVALVTAFVMGMVFFANVENSIVERMKRKYLGF